MKIQDKILLDYINSKTDYRTTDTSTTQEVWCHERHYTVPFEVCEICPDKCSRYRNLMVFLQEHDYFKGDENNG